MGGSYDVSAFLKKDGYWRIKSFMLTNTGLWRQKPSHHTCGKAIRFSYSGYLNLSLKHWLLRVQTCWSMIFLFRIHNHILNDVSRQTQRPCGIFIPFEINLAHEMFYRNIVFAALVWQLVPLPGVDPWSELFNHFLFCFSFILKMNFRVIVQSQIWFFNFFPDFLLFGGEFWRNLLQTLIYVREKIWFLFCMYWYKDHMGFFNFLKTLLKYLIEIL